MCDAYVYYFVIQNFSSEKPLLHQWGVWYTSIYNVQCSFYSTQSLCSIVIIFPYRTSLGNKSRDGNTPLHLCAIENKTECMKLLLRTRPELAKIENSEGKTPLDIAKEKNNQLCAELVCVLRFYLYTLCIRILFYGTALFWGPNILLQKKA